MLKEFRELEANLDSELGKVDLHDDDDQGISMCDTMLQCVVCVVCMPLCALFRYDTWESMNICI